VIGVIRMNSIISDISDIRVIRVIRVKGFLGIK
jgi:hypothetical protein